MIADPDTQTFWMIDRPGILAGEAEWLDYYAKIAEALEAHPEFKAMQQEAEHALWMLLNGDCEHGDDLN